MLPCFCNGCWLSRLGDVPVCAIGWWGQGYCPMCVVWLPCCSMNGLVFRERLQPAGRVRSLRQDMLRIVLGWTCSDGVERFGPLEKRAGFFRGVVLARWWSWRNRQTREIRRRMGGHVNNPLLLLLYPLPVRSRCRMVSSKSPKSVTNARPFP